MQLKYMKYRKQSYWVYGFLVAVYSLPMETRCLLYGLELVGSTLMYLTLVSAVSTLDKLRGELAKLSEE